MPGGSRHSSLSTAWLCRMWILNSYQIYFLMRCDIGRRPLAQFRCYCNLCYSGARDTAGAHSKGNAKISAIKTDYGASYTAVYAFARSRGSIMLGASSIEATDDRQVTSTGAQRITSVCGNWRGTPLAVATCRRVADARVCSLQTKYILASACHDVDV